MSGSFSVVYRERRVLHELYEELLHASGILPLRVPLEEVKVGIPGDKNVARELVGICYLDQGFL